MRHKMMRFWDAVASAGPYETICTSLQTDNHTNTSLLNFYRPNALPDAQSTVSKHRRHKHYKKLVSYIQLNSQHDK